MIDEYQIEKDDIKTKTDLVEYSIFDVIDSEISALKSILAEESK